MVAQLIINSIYQPRYNHYLPKLNRWAKRRDALDKAGYTEAAVAAHQRVTYYFDKMHERGCFGDNYQHNLLNLFGSCWHRDIADGLLNQRDKLRPSDAERLLTLLRDRKPILEAKLRKVKRVEGMSRAETTRYYRDKYARLQALLRLAINQVEAIDFLP